MHKKEKIYKLFKIREEFEKSSFRICLLTSVIIQNCQSCAKVNTLSGGNTFLPFVENGQFPWERTNKVCNRRIGKV